jgi:hypothetical protein
MMGSGVFAEMSPRGGTKNIADPIATASNQDKLGRVGSLAAATTSSTPRYAAVDVPIHSILL